ncbi:MAG: HipA domain-containing protein, partial [Candidatus Dormibacteraceae bacterium]
EVNGHIQRLHQEDFCQALGIPARLKYESDGGPGMAAMLGLIRRHSTDVAADTDAFIERIAFNYLIGNADAHAKNFSLLYTSMGVRLAPAYDLLSTAIYPRLSKNMATTINRMWDPGGIQPIHWAKQLDRLELSRRLYGARLADLASRVRNCFAEAEEWMKELDCLEPQFSEIKKLVEQRAQILSSISNLG